MNEVGRVVSSLSGWWQRFRVVIAVGVSTLASVLLYGYNYGSDPNLAQLLPFIHKLQNPALYPGDPYIQSLASFPSMYPRLVALLCSPHFLPVFHAAAYAATLLVFFWLIYKLALLLFEDGTVALIATVLAALSPLVTVLSILGDDPILKTSFYQTSMAAPVSLGALYLFLRGNFTAALAMAGALYWLNGLPANYLAALLAAGTLVSENRKKMLTGWVLFAAFFASWLWWKYSLPNEFAPASTGYAQALRGWYAGHYFPLAWGAEKWARAAEYLVLLGVLIWRSAGQTVFKKQLLAFSAAVLAMWMAAFFCSEVCPNPALISAQLFRSDTLLIMLGILCAAHYIAELLRSEVYGDWFLAAIFLLALTELGRPYVAPFAGLALLARLFWPRALAPVAAICAGACIFYAFSAPSFIMKTGAAALLFSGLCLSAFGKCSFPRRSRWALVALAFLHFFPVMLERRRVGLEYLTQRERDWRAVQCWAAEHTTENAEFFTPINLQGFRVFSRRSSVCEWLDGAAMHWAPGFENVWRDRLQDVYVLTGGAVGYPERLDAARRAMFFTALGHKYGASYVVDERQDLLPFPLLYSGGGFRVYRIPSAQGL